MCRREGDVQSLAGQGNAKLDDCFKRMREMNEGDEP
jgi:hypothetical protein